MSKKKKKGNAKARTNAVPLTATFGKKKVKVGRILKKTNVTDTRIKTQKVVLMEQLREKRNAEPVSHRGLTLNEICRRLSHYSENVCREAIIDFKEMLTNDSSLVEKNLRIIIPSVGRLISAGMKEESTKCQLKALLRLIFGVPADVMRSHFGLLMNHVLTALTDIRVPVKLYAFDVLLDLLRRFPALVLQRVDVFDRFLELLASERRPTNVAQLLEAVALFRNVYDTLPQTSFWQNKNEIKIDVENCVILPAKPISILPLPSAIHFPVLYPMLASSTAAVIGHAEREARLARLAKIAAQLRVAVVEDEDGASNRRKRIKK